jgi:hypothetical protein
MGKVNEIFYKVQKEYGDDYTEFEKVENKRSNRPDLHAMIILDELIPGKRNMVSSAEHDEMWLDVDEEELEKVITHELALELYRCGFQFCEYGSLHRFV